LDHGSLYTNVIPNLLVKGVAKAIKESKAFKVYVSNLMTEPGQTENFTLSDHIKTIIEHAGKGIIEYCIYDTGELIPEYIRRYNMQGQEIVEVDAPKAKAEGVYLMQREISYIENDYIRHNPEAIAASIIQLICDDLKFRDMQNDAKYVLLNDKLKTAKKSLKEGENFRKPKTKAEKGESKFYQKYKERIESIQEAEIKMKVKEGVPEEQAVKEIKGKYNEKKTEEKNKKASQNKNSAKKANNKKTDKKANNQKEKKKSSSKHSKDDIQIKDIYK
jgi:hypothetical protein